MTSTVTTDTWYAVPRCLSANAASIAILMHTLLYLAHLLGVIQAGVNFDELLMH